MMEERIKDFKLISENQGSSYKMSIKNMQIQDQARNIQIPIILNYILKKIKFWQSLKNEDADINYLSAQIKSIGLHTLEVQNQFQIQKLQYDKQIYNQSPILLKIESIFKAIVENDLLTSVELQKNVNDMLSKQQYQIQEIANYLDLMKGSLILVQVSLVKNPGSILNKNKSQILNLFQFSQNDHKTLTSINQLMPSLFANIHNDLMKTSVIKGFSRLYSSYNQIFAQNKYGFLIPVKLKVDHLYDQKDDFVLNGSIFHCPTSNQYIILNQYGFIEGITEYLYQILFQDNFQLSKVIGKFNILFLIQNFFNLIKECNQNDKDLISTVQSRASLNIEQQNYVNYDSEYQLNQQIASLRIPRQIENQIRQFNELHEQQIIKEQQSQSTQKKEQKKQSESQKVNKLFKKFLAQNQQINNQTIEQKDFNINFDLQHKILKIYDEKTQQFQKHKSYYIMQITQILSYQKDSLQKDFDKTNYSPTQYKQFSMQSNDQSIEKSLSGQNYSNQSPSISYKKQIFKQNKIQEFGEKSLKKIDFFDNVQNSKQFDGSNLISNSIFAKLDDLKKLEINNNLNFDSKINSQFIYNYPEYQISPNNYTMSFSPQAFNPSHQIISSRQIIQTELTQRDQIIKSRDTQQMDYQDQQQKQEHTKDTKLNLQSSDVFYLNQYKSSTKIEKNQSDIQGTVFADKKQNNNKLENEFHQQTSLSSSFVHKNKYQNQDIRKIIQIKNIPILKLPFLIINLRLLMFLSFMVAASLVTSLKINQIYGQIGNSTQIGEFIKFYSESYLMNQKSYLINQNLLDSQIIQEFSDQIQNNLSQIEDEYDQVFYDKVKIINTLQEQDKLYNITIFAQKQQYLSQVTAFEFFLNAVNSIWVLGKGDIIQFINNLYFLVENYLNYCQMIDDFNGKLFSQLLNLKDNLKIIYIALIITLFIIIALLFFIGAYCIYRLIQYKQKIILLVTRLSMKDVDKEILTMSNFLNYLQDQNFSWQDFNFPEYIISHSDASQREENNTKGSYIKKHLIHSKQQVLSDTAVSGADSKHKKRLTTQSTEKKINKIKNIKEQENSKISSQSLISSKVQGQSLIQWKYNLLFMTSLIVCGIFYLLVLGISYVITQGLDPSFNLLQQTSEFYTKINKALLLSQNIIGLPLISNVDTNYPNSNFQQQMNNLINSIYDIQLFNNNYLGVLSKVTASSQEDIKIIENLFTQDICNYFQDSDLCLNPQSQSQIDLRNIIKNGVSGLITSYITHFDNIIQIINYYSLTKSQKEISQYLNNESYFYFIINSYDIPFQSINLIFEKVVYINQTTVSQLLNLTLIYFVTFGAILIAIQMIVDILIKSQIKNNVLLYHLSLSLIPIQIQALDTTSQILKSIYKF
ncbi:transmembrane protein, putative (macronuclear) [Tetrahymena thermophila SB210]|uniref:Transmembrane protein, putative n=1 Tax=Tetrahymena thermophila (strain SB210) TaxID=312017 RepID=I7M1J9_TETTS|nr:transmembrane protein, putative [Tetrahymena thermophila SB210]EAR96484.2 transmembrane protein, putative [Tetrahymena thermophila SB210]|eukprot:XP_001016729.2 transmembrane protein, putative [Tetrahymena thermophila SB210]